MTHYDVIIGMRYIIKISDGYEHLCAEKGVPKIFKGIATAKTIQAVLINNSFWLPISGITMTEDIYLTGDAYKEKEGIPDLPITVLAQWEHQKKTTAFIRANGSGLVFLGMGTGKTKCTVDIAYNDPNCKAILIVCPKSLPPTWRSEFLKHAKEPERFELITRYPSAWTVKKRAAYYKERVDIALGSGKIPVVTVNYDVVYHEEMFDFIMGVPWSHIVCDESQKIKSPTGKTSKAMWQIGDKFDGKAMKLLLTGTPMPHSLLDLWSQFRFLNSRVFGISFPRFQKHFCVRHRLGNKTYVDKLGRERPIEVISHYQHTDELRKLMFQHAIKFDRDVITLPEAVHTIIKVPLESSARRIYDGLKEEMRAILGTTDEYGDINEMGEITVANSLVKTIRLSQVTGGSLPDDSGFIHQVSTAKREALFEVIEDIDPKEPLVIFCLMRHDIDTCKSVAMEQGRTVSELSGRMHQLEQWQQGETNTLVVQVRAGGVGIDLTRACYNIMYSTGHSAGDYEQAICRSHRPGQLADHVNFIHIHVINTIDGIIYNAIQRKQSIIAAIVDHIRQKKVVDEDE